LVFVGSGEPRFLWKSASSSSLDPLPTTRPSRRPSLSWCLRRAQAVVQVFRDAYETDKPSVTPFLLPLSTWRSMKRCYEYSDCCVVLCCV